MISSGANVYSQIFKHNASIKLLEKCYLNYFIVSMNL